MIAMPRHTYTAQGHLGMQDRQLNQQQQPYRVCQFHLLPVSSRHVQAACKCFPATPAALQPTVCAGTPMHAFQSAPKTVFCAAHCTSCTLYCTPELTQHRKVDDGAAPQLQRSRGHAERISRWLHCDGCRCCPGTSPGENQGWHTRLQ